MINFHLVFNNDSFHSDMSKTLLTDDGFLSKINDDGANTALFEMKL